MFRKFLTTILFSAAVLQVSALDISAGLNGFADNREYHSRYRNSQTFFGIRGIALGSQNISEHAAINAGLSWMMEFGSDTLRLPKPVLYFSYSDSSTFFRLGSFPRNESIDVPEFLIADSMTIYRPNIQGAVFKRFNGGISRAVWIDWIGRQADSVRESFLFGTQLDAKLGRVDLSGNMLYVHTARSMSGDTNEHVTDDGGMNLCAKLPFRTHFLDSMRVSLNGFLSWHRVRDLESWYTPLGAEASIEFAKGFFGFRASYWQMLWTDPTYTSAYTDLGDACTDRRFQYGDGEYWNSSFASFDPFFVLARKAWLKARFDAIFTVEDHMLETRQKFTLIASFGHHIKRFRKS